MALTPSQRVKLMSAISERLGDENWTLVDATLRAFSLPSTDTWNGTTSSYILRMIEAASDQSLLDLAEHVGFQFDVKPIRLDPPFWKKGMFRLFVSHLSSEQAFAAGIQQGLLNFGISSFVAHKDVEPTSDWQTEIETALATCDALMALLHPNFHQSNWTDQEIGYAMGRGVPVFSMRFGQDPYGFIGR